MNNWLDELKEIPTSKEKQILRRKDIYVKCIACKKDVHVSKNGYNCIVCKFHMDKALNGIIEFSIKNDDGSLEEWKQENNKLFKIEKPNKHIWNGQTKLEADILEGSEYGVPSSINLGNVEESSLNFQVDVIGLDEEGLKGFDRDVDQLPKLWEEWVGKELMK